MASAIMAGVGNIQLFDGSGNLILTSKTLTDSGISINTTGEDIRGGLSSPLIGRYFHDSTFDLNLVDALFSLEYLSLNVGGAITIGGSAITEEQVTIVAENTITVTGTPQEFSTFGTVGYYTIAGKDNYQKITFTGKNATVSGLSIGTTVCVKYFNEYANLRQFIVPSTIIPSECYAILTAPLFSAGGEKITASSKIGDLVVEIPRFQLSGAQEFSDYAVLIW